MTPQLATLCTIMGILVAFQMVRDPKARTSKALWIPALWLFVASSRNISEWMSIGAPVEQQSEAYLEGNPIDRNALGAMLFLGLVVLLMRRQRLREMLRTNTPVLVYFFYCLVSMLWSAYPLVSFKRWTRAIGDLVMVAVVLTDPDRLSAIKRLLVRVGFLVLPLSVLFIRYYPDLGRSYGASDGSIYWTGVAEGKNTLGVMCQIFGAGFLWCFLEAYNQPKGTRRSRSLAVYGIMILIALWLLWEANSMTSISCLFWATTILLVTNIRRFAGKPMVPRLLVITAIVFSIFVLFSGGGGGILKSVGRNPTLTGRTEIWGIVLQYTANPLVGAGYESFWLGDRLAEIQKAQGTSLNQCHNGYLEVYMNLGWVGIILLLLLIATGFKNASRAIRQNSATGKLKLAYFVAGVLYCFTEAGFKMMSPIWIFFLMSVMAVPPDAAHQEEPTLETELAQNYTAGELQSDHGLSVGMRERTF